MKKPEKRLNWPWLGPLPRRRAIARRDVTIAAIVAAISLSACGSQSSSDYSQIFEFAKKSFAGNEQNITLKQAAAVPYASIGVRIGDSPQQMLVLATDSGDEQLWTSASHIVLSLRDGRIVRTVGLSRDLSDLRLMKSMALKSPRASLSGPVQQTLLADFADLGIYSTPISCMAKEAAAGSIDILGQEIKTVRIEERCEDADLGWAFTNTYWIDPATGQLWRSVQHIHPDADTVEIDVLRPPAG